MEVSVSQQQGRVPITLFHVKGDIDSSTHAQLQAQIEQSIQGGTRNVLLDLTEVGYLSSAGIRLLSRVFNLLRSKSPEENDDARQPEVSNSTFKSPHLKLVSPTPRVADVLKMSGIDMLIDSYRSVPEAVAAF